jgi:hypothetical protein
MAGGFVKLGAAFRLASVTHSHCSGAGGKCLGVEDMSIVGAER